ncbi:MAG: cupin domain-containing protein [Chromatiales bacterium]|nr:cupin domain-containing protein [Chromatiales bacterium]
MQPILYERRPAPGKLDVMGVDDWPIWEKEVSVFPWTYDAQETCYILKGHVIVTPDGGEPVELGAGDLVTFAKGLSCTWDIREPIKKHYSFD